jgi:SAM-dependent methyltransferase
MKALLRKVFEALLTLFDRLHCRRLKMCLVHLRYVSASLPAAANFAQAAGAELAYGLLDRVCKRRRCPVCGWTGWEYSPVFLNDNYRPATRCPECLTYERHRLLHRRLTALRGEDISPRVLFVGPNIRFTRSLFKDNAFTIDIYPHNHADVLGDLVRLPFANRSFDIVVCFRVLEHVGDDAAALEGLRRILTPSGRLFLSVPLYEGLPHTYDYSRDRMTCQRGPTWCYPDHRRDYAAEDLEHRIRAAGMEVERIVPNPNDPEEARVKTRPDNDTTGRRLGLTYIDIVFECRPAS